MFYQAALAELEWQDRKSAIQFVKIGLKERLFMNKEKEQVEGIGFQDASFLKELIKRSRKGDVQAMEAIYAHLNRPIFNLIYRHTNNFNVAEDLLQDVFLKVFTNLQYIKKEETFIGWVYRIALNSCFSYLRGKKTLLQKTVSLSEVEEKIEEGTCEPGDKMMKEPLEDAIQSLAHKSKSVFLLHDVQGFKHEEIAGMLGCSVGTSKSQLFKARMKIREYLANKKIL